jgi:putative lipoprotein
MRRPGGNDEAVPAEPAYTMEFGADGRYSGQAHCNRHIGGYATPGDGRLELTAGAATLAACPEPSIADEFLRALGAVERYELRADRLLLTYDTTGVLTFARDAGSIAAAFPETGRTHVFDCAPGVRFTVRTGPGEIALWPPESVGGRYIVLGASASDSGTRYEDGDDVVVLEDDRATFQITGQRFEDCAPNQRAVPWADAARRGVTFRAIGNEPAWHIEVSPMMLTMTTNLGADRAELAYEEPVVEALRTTYRAAGDGHELVAVVERAPCVDTMSGEPFEATATVTFDRRDVPGVREFSLSGAPHATV